MVTLEGVEDGEEVHEGHVDGAPGEQREAPGHAQQEGQADDAPQVPQHLVGGGTHVLLEPGGAVNTCCLTCLHCFKAR